MYLYVIDNRSLECLPKYLGKLKTSHKSKAIFFLLAETFQALGDPSRVQIVWALSHGELSVGEVASLLEMSQPSVSPPPQDSA